MISRTARRALAALALVLWAGGAQAQAVQRVVLGAPAPWSVQFAYLAFGEQLGFFREEGLQVERVAVTGSAVLLPQVANGQVTFGVANADIMVLALARGEPMPLRMVQNWFRLQSFEFVVLQDSPIRSLAELRGRKLGVGALTFGNIPLTRTMLANAGLAWQRDVEPLPVGLGPAAWRRLQTGGVDALNLFVTEHVRMEITGIAIRRLPIPDPFRAIFSNGIVAGDQTIERQPQVVAGFGRALVKSWIACREAAAPCVRAWWAANPASRPPAGQEPQQLQADMRIAMADRDSIDGFIGDAPRLYGHYTEESWRQMIAVMHAEGQIARADLEIARLYTNRFVEDYNRFDRAAVIAAAQRAN